MRFENRLGLLLLLVLSRLIHGSALECLAFRRSRAIGVNVEYLIEAKPREQIPAAIPAVNDMKMTSTKLLQAQRHAGHCSHECGIHHRAIRQINDKLAITAVQHLARKLFQVAAIEETTFSLYFHPYGRTIYPYLNR